MAAGRFIDDTVAVTDSLIAPTIVGSSRASGSPFGGYKQSGNGREGGEHGFMEFLEVKAVSGWTTTS